ncbi:hypothetical protein L195_g054931 [Trifolium pratense]|uniref:Uncharacterized protein n=1 Tax=Trifolium pratense TaxID=57577 RepID=A0A2K3KIN5_TRIPR|nr:hypothetical protein L195_g054931 [Trifolium pratense]
MKRFSIDDEALFESCWEIRVLMREKKGVILFENWGEGKVLIMVERSGSAARRWLRAVSSSPVDDNGFAIGGGGGGDDEGERIGFLVVSFGIFLAGKGIFEEFRVLIWGCGLLLEMELDLVWDRVRFMVLGVKKL